MVKYRTSIMIEKEIMEQLDEIIQKKFLGLLSRSALIQYIIKDYIEKVTKGDISIELRGEKPS